jgi:isopentenyl-diphosphate delta-isomerase
MDPTRRVVLCDEKGNPVRSASLLEAHRGDGLLHRAFSVFVFRNAASDLLIQRRSDGKALFPLRWGNTCCSHPGPGDDSLIEAAQRRLGEELGFSVELGEAGAFVYRAEDPRGGWSEYEHDTVIVGSIEGAVSIRADPQEIGDWRWIAVADLERGLRDHAAEYVPWLPQALRIALASPLAASPRRKGDT